MQTVCWLLLVLHASPAFSPASPAADAAAAAIAAAAAAAAAVPCWDEFIFSPSKNQVAQNVLSCLAPVESGAKVTNPLCLSPENQCSNEPVLSQKNIFQVPFFFAFLCVNKPLVE